VLVAEFDNKEQVFYTLIENIDVENISRLNQRSEQQLLAHRVKHLLSEYERFRVIEEMEAEYDEEEESEAVDDAVDGIVFDEEFNDEELE
jgi:hypothetical protein